MFMVGYLFLLLIRLLLDSKTFGPFAAACCRKKILVYYVFWSLCYVEQQK